MFSLHLPQRLAPISKSFAGFDPMALVVIVFALASAGLIVSAFLFV
jgi:hypothetical protein